MTTVLQPPTVPGTLLCVMEGKKNSCIGQRKISVCGQLSRRKLAVDRADKLLHCVFLVLLLLLCLRGVYQSETKRPACPPFARLSSSCRLVFTVDVTFECLWRHLVTVSPSGWTATPQLISWFKRLPSTPFLFCCTCQFLNTERLIVSFSCKKKEMLIRFLLDNCMNVGKGGVQGGYDSGPN